MENIPQVKLALVAASRDCFPSELSAGRAERVPIEGLGTADPDPIRGGPEDGADGLRLCAVSQGSGTRVGNNRSTASTSAREAARTWGSTGSPFRIPSPRISASLRRARRVTSRSWIVPSSHDPDRAESVWAHGRATASSHLAILESGCEAQQVPKGDAEDEITQAPAPAEGDARVQADDAPRARGESESKARPDRPTPA